MDLIVRNAFVLQEGALRVADIGIVDARIAVMSADLSADGPELDIGGCLILPGMIEKPDLTLHALLAELGERGVVVSCDTLWRFLKRQGISFKKTVFATEQDRPDIARRRAWWKRHQLKIDPARLVFIDETWAKTNMARTHGWWRRGFPLRAQVPHGHWRTMTFLAALRHDRIVAPCVIDGPINGESFRAYVEQVLVPTLQPGDINGAANLMLCAALNIRGPWFLLGF